MRAPPEIDKEGEARRLKLTPLAREALERIAPEEGLIFGRYDYRRTLRKAAAKVIREERARYLTLRDLRHAALTDLAECTQSVGAVAAVAGHRDLQTTSRYFNARQLRPSEPEPWRIVGLKLERKLEQSKIPKWGDRLYPEKKGMDA